MGLGRPHQPGRTPVPSRPHLPCSLCILSAVCAFSPALSHALPAHLYLGKGQGSVALEMMDPGLATLPCELAGDRPLVAAVPFPPLCWMGDVADPLTGCVSVSVGSAAGRGSTQAFFLPHLPLIQFHIAPCPKLSELRASHPHAFAHPACMHT